MVKRRRKTEGWQARFLREAACEWAEHIHDEPQDPKDSACKRRWERLALAAYDYARSRGKVPVRP